MCTYDYTRLGDFEDLLCFYAGWTSQKLCWEVHSAMVGDAGAGRCSWQMAGGEARRLLLLYDSWRRAQGSGWGEEFAVSLGELMQHFSDGGWWGSEAALGEIESVSADIMEPPLFDLAAGDQPFFPLLDVDQPDSYEWVAAPVVRSVASALRLLGEAAGKVEVVRYGVRLAGLSYCMALRHPQELARRTLDHLVAAGIASKESTRRMREIANVLPPSPEDMPFPPRPLVPREGRIWRTAEFDGAEYAKYSVLALDLPRTRPFYMHEWCSRELTIQSLACVFSHYECPSPPIDPEDIDGALIRRIQHELGSALSSSVEGVVNIFRNAGDRWEVRFNGGDTKYPEDLLGMRELAYLLAHPGETFTADDLWDEFGDKPPVGAAHPPYEDGISEHERPSHMGERADRSDLGGLQEQLGEFGEERRQAEKRSDRAALDEIGRKVSRIRAYMAESFSKDGTPRHAIAPEIRRARDAMRKRFKRVLKAMQRNCPELHEHLQDALEYGRSCVYRPAPSVEWETEN